MEAISQIFSFISGLGKYVMIPLMVSLIGIAFKCNPNKAIKGGVTVGIGLFGLDLALSLVSKYLVLNVNLFTNNLFKLIKIN